MSALQKRIAAHPGRLALIVYAPVSIASAAFLGVLGWAICTSVLACAFFSAAIRIYVTQRSEQRSRTARESDDALTVLPLAVTPFEAELLCQGLERAGIRATYFGRADPESSIPGGGVGFGSTRRYRVGVRASEVQRAMSFARQNA
jgi:hypothetical protein